MPKKAAKNSVDIAHPKCRLQELREAVTKEREAFQQPPLSLREIARAVKYRHKGGKLEQMSVAGVWRVEKGGEVTLSVARALAEFFDKDLCEVWPT